MFAFEPGETGAPLIAEAPVVMECRVDDVYETKGFESFVCEIVAVHADESVLNADGKIDYRALKPVLFEMPTYEYLRTGDVIAPCTTLGKAELPHAAGGGGRGGPVDREGGKAPWSRRIEA